MTQTRLIEKEEDKKYKCCPLYKTRINIVWSRGTSIKDVDALFIGEAPGKEEDILGKPFIGRAGKLLDNWISDANILSYAIVNIIKCRPPGNRKPNQDEIRSCFPYLIVQIQQFNPKLIVVLGATPCSVLIHKKEVIPNIGKVFKSSFGPVIVFPHPAFILRGFGAYVPIKELKEALKIIKQPLVVKEKISDNTDGLR